MMATKRSVGGAQEVNVRNPLHSGNEVQERGNSPWLWNLEQMSPEDPNKGISGPQKKDSCPSKLKKSEKLYVISWNTLWEQFDPIILK